MFSTRGIDPKDRFQLWREMIFDRIGPCEQTQVDSGPFEGLIRPADVSELMMTMISETAVRTEATPDTMRRRTSRDTVFVVVQVAGSSISLQDDRDSTQHPGDMVLLDPRPHVHVSGREDQSLVIEIPRERLERMLGSTKRYTALTVHSRFAGAALAAGFLNNLFHVHQRLDDDTARRMSKVGVDLIVASIAERLALELPRSLHGTLVVERAKAYVEANLGDPTLDPRQLAVATGVSLRRLQELFHAHGRHISDWIWERRLASAAHRLGDRTCDHLAIATIAFGCGFSHPAHFSRRFRDRYGVTPREFRYAARA